MKIKRFLAAIGVAAALVGGPAVAQSTTPAPAPKAAAPTAASPMSTTATPTPAEPTTPVSDRKARSAECSALADKQGLHGKPRHTFRSKCIHQK